MIVKITLTAKPGCPPNAVDNAIILLTVVRGEFLRVKAYKEIEAQVRSASGQPTADMTFFIQSPGCKIISSWAYNVKDVFTITRYYTYELEPKW